MDQQKIINIITETLGVDRKDITAEAKLYDDFNCARLEVNDLMMKIIQELEINADEVDCQNIHTVGDILSFCEEHTDEI